MIGAGEIAEGLGRAFTSAREGLADLVFRPVIRLGVTGLARSGKTVFITSLVANLLHAGRMAQLRAVRDGRLIAARLEPQPDDDVPRFDYEGHLALLAGDPPAWPASTRAVSELRLALTLRRGGMLGGMAPPATIYLDIVDYPGEWLLDLPLLDMSYAQWSAEALNLARAPARAEHSAGWLGLATEKAAGAGLDEGAAQALARAFTEALAAARDRGLSATAPGRFLMPGDLRGSPALTFAPLPGKGGRGSLWQAFERRFEAYKRHVVLPFFRDHFSRLDRQIVLIDVLGALEAGPQAVADLSSAMAGVLTAFKPGRNTWLAPLTGRRVERLLFAATKADYLHHSQHEAFAAIAGALVKDARARAEFKGARTAALALAALRATVEDQHGKTPVVRGVLAANGKTAALHPGTLPDDPAELLSPPPGQGAWLHEGFARALFRPPVLAEGGAGGLPHIRLDRALQFLIGDRL